VTNQNDNNNNNNKQITKLNSHRRVFSRHTTITRRRFRFRFRRARSNSNNGPQQQQPQQTQHRKMPAAKPDKEMQQEFLSAREQQRFVALQGQRNQAGPELGDLKPMAPRTWRQNVPVWKAFEYWQLRADQYPHIQRSDEDTNFFLRGITCHPRLSDFPTCKDVIQDYFRCRDDHPWMQVLNICAPIKEQMSACINEVFVRSSHRVSKKTSATLDNTMDQRRERRLNKMKAQAEEMKEKREKFVD
jgi:hypothetical protein